MSSIIFAVLAVSVIGVVCAVMLSVVSKVMAIKTDPLVEALRALLPGANCGACGFAGCDGYAAALAAEEKTNLCTPGGPDVSRRISEELGVGFEAVTTRAAVMHCRGDCTVCQDKMEYAGIKSCAAAKIHFGGQSACVYGCIGYGDCVNACPSRAIRIVNGIAKIDTSVCTGCGLCVKTCPNSIITTEEDSIHTVVGCSNREKGAVVRKICQRGCIACKKCERECKAGAIIVEGNLAGIDYSKCDSCGHCAEICPVRCIQQASFAGVFRKEEQEAADDAVPS